MNILITGGAGFIGGHLSERLISLNHKVTVMDDLSTGTLKNLAKIKDHAEFSFHKASVLDPGSLDGLVKGQDLIIHFAATVGVKLIMEQPLRAITTNIEGTKNVLEAADKYQVRTFLASTSEVYGKNTKFPFSEHDDRTIGPSQITRWNYAESKAMDEFLGLAYFKEKKLPVVIPRFFNVIGPRQTSTWGMVAPRFVEAAIKGEPLTVYGTGEQRRCLGFVGDIVEALVRLIDCPEANGEIINLGNNQELTINELAQLVLKITGSRSKIDHQSYESVYGKDFEDMMRRVPDLRKIKDLTGWQPTTSVETAITAIYEDLKEA